MGHVIYLNIVMNYLYENFICENGVFMHTFMHCINSIEFTVLYDSVSHDESNA